VFYLRATITKNIFKVEMTDPMFTSKSWTVLSGFAIALIVGLVYWPPISTTNNIAKDVPPDATAAPGLVTTNRSPDTASINNTAINTIIQGEHMDIYMYAATDEVAASIAIQTKDGNRVTEVHDGSDSTVIESFALPANTTIDIVKLIPASKYDQIRMISSEPLPDDAGSIATLTLYNVIDNYLESVLMLVTDRRRITCNGNDSEASCPLYWHADYTIDAAATPTINVNYTLNDAEVHTLSLYWNGKSFVDPSGSFEPLMAKLIP